MNKFSFKGLNPYNEFDSDNFFGREKAIENALEILQSNKILTISGDSGIGKTSFAKAGIINRIKSGLPAKSGKSWSVFSTRPGVSPIENLCNSLSNNGDLYKNSKPKASDYQNYYEIFSEKKELGLIQIYKNSEIFNKKNILIFIDQVEDLFKYPKVFNNESSEEDDLFFNLIYKSVKNKSCSIYFVLCVESNFISKLNIYGKFSELLSLSQFNLPNIDVKKIIFKIRDNINVSLSDSIIENIKTEISEKPSLLTNFQYLLNEYNKYESEDKDLISELYDKNGGLKNILNSKFENYFNSKNQDSREIIEKLFRSLVNADFKISNNFYQKFRYIREYINISSKELTKILLNINSEFGKIFDILPSKMSDVKSINNYVVNDNDIIVLKYSDCINWDKLIFIVEEELFFFKQFKKLHRIVKSEKEINQKELNAGIELLKNKFVDKEWTKKYNFDFNKIKKFIYEEDQKRKTQREFLILQKEKERKRKKLVRIGFLLLVAGGVVLGVKRHLTANDLREKNKKFIAVEKENDTLIHQNDSLLKYVINLNKEIKQDQKKISKQEIELKDKEYQIAKNLSDLYKEKEELRISKIDNYNKEQEIKEINDKLNVKEVFLELTKDELSLNKKILELTKEIKHLRVTEKEKIYNKIKVSLDYYEDYKNIKKSEDSLLEIHVDWSKSVKNLKIYSEENEIIAFKKLTNIIISKINGVENITRVKEFDLLRGFSENKKERINVISISKDGRIFSGGKIGELYYSISKETNPLKMEFEKINFKSEITSILPINSDVVAVGLINGEIWYSSIKDKIKLKIFPEKKVTGQKEISSLLFHNNRIYSVNNNQIVNYNLNNKVLSRINLPLLDKEYLIDLSFDGNNNFYTLSDLGNIYEYDLDDLSNTLVFDTNNSILSKKEKVTKIKFFDNQFLFSTSDGWIYVFDKEKNRLKYNQRVIAHNSGVLNFFYDHKLNKIFSTSVKGEICMINLDKKNERYNSSIEFDLGQNNLITDIKSYNVENKSFFITSSINGNLTYWGLDLKDSFRYIKNKINN